MVRGFFRSPQAKDVLREIWNTRGRFVSMTMIAMLGAMMVVGIRAAAINMRGAASEQYLEANLFDLQLRGPALFSAEEAARIAALDGVMHAEASNIADAYVQTRDGGRVARLSTLMENVNRVTAAEGRLPAAHDEIAVDRRLLRDAGLSVGDMLPVEGFGEFRIVGVARSPLYLTGDIGGTALGSGRVNYYAYLQGGALGPGLFSDIFVVMEESRGMHQVSREYNEAALRWREEIGRHTDAFALTRQNVGSFESYFQDSLRLDSVGRVFPLLFYAVAVLVALTAISRMVEEQRGQLGIYKALGYSPYSALAKYCVYAAGSGLLGGLLGSVLGSVIIPRVIFDAYGHLYAMPLSSHPVPWLIAAAATLASASAVSLTAALSCAGIFRQEPAELMRPKAPKPGKRIFLEKVPFVWRRFGFINKVTARNIFRYKKRFFMSLFGVAGCTALVLTAFGLRDSVGSVALFQFGDIFAHDFELWLAPVDENAMEKLEGSADGGALFLRRAAVDAFTDGGGFRATLVAPLDFGRLSEFVRPLAPGTRLFGRGREHVDTYGVLVTEKLAREMGVAAGDSFSVLMGHDVFELRADGIVENYVLHYVYVPPGIYEEVFGSPPQANGMFVRGRADEESLLALPYVLGVSNTALAREGLTIQADALGVVTVVILLMACLLAFVVMYNLTEVNIIERTREIATVKVLGFYDIETAMYLYRENFAVTVLGVLLGLPMGVALNSMILYTVEIDFLKFPHVVLGSSFALAAALSALFALLVNGFTYARLVRIDMVGALKSVE